jgi:hypothetical protein
MVWVSTHIVSSIDFGRGNRGLQVEALATTETGASFAIGTKRRSALALAPVSRRPLRQRLKKGELVR